LLGFLAVIGRTKNNSGSNSRIRPLPILPISYSGRQVIAFLSNNVEILIIPPRLAAIADGLEAAIIFVNCG